MKRLWLIRWFVRQPCYSWMSTNCNHATTSGCKNNEYKHSHPRREKSSHLSDHRIDKFAQDGDNSQDIGNDRLESALHN
jgi:hypothetical protein